MVIGSVFKVAVLHQLCIQSSVGGIAYILKEYTYQFVADILIFSLIIIFNINIKAINFTQNPSWSILTNTK